ncbi:MAG TPA: hypothetical protein VKP52_09380, partial [Pseudolabrys sp.]|nr:hypothetical protein [Pseudolabrys sp.]
LSRKFPDEPRSCAIANPVGMSSANASTAMEELEAKRAQSRVRVIGKFEAKLVLLRACSVSEKPFPGFGIHAGVGNSSGCVA